MKAEQSRKKGRGRIITFLVNSKILHQRGKQQHLFDFGRYYIIFFGERLKAKGEDSFTNSVDMNLSKPQQSGGRDLGMLLSMGLQRAGRDWGTDQQQQQYNFHLLLLTFQTAFAKMNINTPSTYDSFVCVQSLLTLFGPMYCSMPGSSVHGILGKSTGVGCHSFLRASSQPRDRTLTSFVSCIGRWILYHYNSFGEHVWDSFWLTEQVQALMSFLFWEQQGARPNLDNLSLYLVLKSPEFTHSFKVFTPVHTWKSAPDGIMPEADACCFRGGGNVFLCEHSEHSGMANGQEGTFLPRALLRSNETSPSSLPMWKTNVSKPSGGSGNWEQAGGSPWMIWNCVAGRGESFSPTWFYTPLPSVASKLSSSRPGRELSWLCSSHLEAE